MTMMNLVNVLPSMALLLATVSCQATPIETEKSTNARANSQFILYNQQNQTNGIILNDANLQNVNQLLRLIFIIHGFSQSGSSPPIIALKDAYLNKAPANVIVVSWIAVVWNVPSVGKLTGDLIYNLTNHGYAQLENTQVNGFSIGAQVAGYAGKQVQNKTGGSRIARIIGLDAVGPGFEGRDPSERLASTDASCVQAIHTSAGTYGYISPYGTVDFEVNYSLIRGCGATQPGCPLYPGVPGIVSNVACDHIRSIAYLIESINSTNFIGVSCSSCSSFGRKECNYTLTAVMGEDFPCNVTGVYYLSTNKKPHFAKGLAGTKP